MGGDHRRRVRDRGDQPDPARAGRRFRLRLDLAMVEFQSVGDDVRRGRSNLAARRAMAVGRVWRLSYRPAAHPMGFGAQRRGLFPRHRAWLSGLGGGLGDHRRGARLDRIDLGRRGGTADRDVCDAERVRQRRRPIGLLGARPDRLPGRRAVPHRPSPGQQQPAAGAGRGHPDHRSRARRRRRPGCRQKPI